MLKKTGVSANLPCFSQEKKGTGAFQTGVALGSHGSQGPVFPPFGTTSKGCDATGGLGPGHGRGGGLRAQAVAHALAERGSDEAIGVESQPAEAAARLRSSFGAC